MASPKSSRIMVNRLQLLIGIAALVVGALVYLVDRPPDHTYFLYSNGINTTLHNILPNLFGLVGNSLPAFIHVFAFILITAGLTFCKKRGYLIICISWFLVDCAFELGQNFNTWPTSIIPDWFEGIPFLENTENYLSRGTFDMFDLVSIVFGTTIAYFVLLTTAKRREIA